MGQHRTAILLLCMPVDAVSLPNRFRSPGYVDHGVQPDPPVLGVLLPVIVDRLFAKAVRWLLSDSSDWYLARRFVSQIQSTGPLGAAHAGHPVAWPAVASVRPALAFLCHRWLLFSSLPVSGMR